jgi:hypothetical protein
MRILSAAAGSSITTPSRNLWGEDAAHFEAGILEGDSSVGHGFDDTAGIKFP